MALCVSEAPPEGDVRPWNVDQRFLSGFMVSRSDVRKQSGCMKMPEGSSGSAIR